MAYFDSGVLVNTRIMPVRSRSSPLMRGKHNPFFAEWPILPKNPEGFCPVAEQSMPMEAPGVEPGSRNRSIETSTCVVS